MKEPFCLRLQQQKLPEKLFMISLRRNGILQLIYSFLIKKKIVHFLIYFNIT